MKLLDLVSEATRKITTFLVEIVSSLPGKHRRPHLVDLSRSRRGSRKRKSFGSFVRQNNSKMNSSSTPYIKKKWKNLFKLKDGCQFKLKWMEEDGFQGSQGLKLEEKITNEVLPAEEMDCQMEPMFCDMNGLEISIIEQKEVKNQQLNNSVESDQQILNFLYGQEDHNEREEVNVKNGGNQVKLVRKEWWREVGENSQQSVSNLLNSKVQSVIVSGYDSGSSLKKSQKSKRIKRGQKSQNVRRSGLRIINILDLVENQDCPKLFQIPLARIC